MFGFIPDLLLIVIGAGVVLGAWRIAEARKARRSKPADAADRFS